MIKEIDSPGSTQPMPASYGKPPTHCFFCRQPALAKKRTFRVECGGHVILRAHRRCARNFIRKAEKDAQAA